MFLSRFNLSQIAPLLLILSGCAPFRASIANLASSTPVEARVFNNGLTIDSPSNSSIVPTQFTLKGRCNNLYPIKVLLNNSVVTNGAACRSGLYSIILNMTGKSANVYVRQTVGRRLAEAQVVLMAASAQPAPTPTPTPTPAATPILPPTPTPQAACTLKDAGVASSPFITLNANSMTMKTNDNPNVGNPQSDGSYLFAYNSMNSQDVSFPATGYYVFRVKARYYSSFSQASANPYPKMQVAIDGRVVSEADVNSGSLAVYNSNDANFEVEAFQVPAGVHRVSIGAGNWSKEVGQSHYQNLFVSDVAIYSATKSCAAPVQADLSNKTTRDLASVKGIRFGTVLDTGIDVNGNHLNVFKDDPKYQDVLKTNFSHVNPGSVFLMDRIAVSPGVYDFSKADEIVNFANANGMTVTFGFLAWHYFIPQWLIDKNDPAYTRQFLNDYIKTVMTHYKGKIKYWAAVNEALDDSEGMRNSFWHQQYEKALGAGHGDDYIAEVFKAARAVDPSAFLIYNDYDIDQIGRKSDAAYAMIKSLKAAGVPIDGMGFQGHLKMNEPLFLKSTVANLKRFEALGLKTQFSEFDAGFNSSAYPSLYDFNVQAQYYRNMLRACLSTQGCELFTVFGTADKYWWGPLITPPLYYGSFMYDDYSPKPAFEAIKQTLGN